MTIFSSFSANVPPYYHSILAINFGMHQIGSLICSQHDKLMVKMTILFLLCTTLQTCTQIYSMSILHPLLQSCNDFYYRLPSEISLTHAMSGLHMVGIRMAGGQNQYQKTMYLAVISSSRIS